ncbi:hypothetical protein [Helicobacter salomonis]|uniref:hypothetical protein n=1 Tax=Helicobacter salomonis TaxID=56878 RepID=UPI000CF02255|nr:hypothetical protein [Helicobacter salomonis]
MEVKDIRNQPNLYALLNASHLERGEAPVPVKEEKQPQVVAEVSKVEREPNGLKRETYGFLVLELMSDNEYSAFLRATAGMNENEKRLAAQSLYSLTSFYGGQIQEDAKAIERKLDGLQAIQESQFKKALGLDRNFVDRYKNAYDQAYQALDVML